MVVYCRLLSIYWKTMVDKRTGLVFFELGKASNLWNGAYEEALADASRKLAWYNILVHEEAMIDKGIG